MGRVPGLAGPGRVLTALVVEDQTIMREMLTELLQQDSRFVAVVSEGSAAEGRERAASAKPDLVILDVMLPDGHGLDLLEEFRAALPRARIIVLTAHSLVEIAHRAARLGAHGIVMKGAALSELRMAVDRVLAGGIYHCAATARLLHSSIRNPPAPDPLSRRQRQILQLVARGASSKEIAHELGLSEKTVSNHRAAIMRRLGIRDVAGLTRYALREGLVEP
jgi:DNA-binding NarL/FixJ family response regulator